MHVLAIAFVLLAAGSGGKSVKPTPAPAPAAAASASVIPGGFRFGMTKDEVTKTAACTLKDVAVTGGLECPDFAIDGTKRNISFVFGPDGGLKKIQVWFYEGTERAGFEKGVDALLAYLTAHHGTVESATLGAGKPVTRATLLAALDEMPSAEGAPAKAQLKPSKDPADAFVFASVFTAPPHGHFAFLYFQPPRK